MRNSAAVEREACKPAAEAGPRNLERSALQPAAGYNNQDRIERKAGHMVEVQVRSLAFDSGNYSIRHCDSTCESDDTSGSMPAAAYKEWGN